MWRWREVEKKEKKGFVEELEWLVEDEKWKEEVTKLFVELYVVYRNWEFNWRYLSCESFGAVDWLPWESKKYIGIDWVKLRGDERGLGEEEINRRREEYLKGMAEEIEKIYPGIKLKISYIYI